MLARHLRILPSITSSDFSLAPESRLNDEAAGEPVHLANEDVAHEDAMMTTSTLSPPPETGEAGADPKHLDNEDVAHISTDDGTLSDASDSPDVAVPAKRRSPRKGGSSRM